MLQIVAFIFRSLKKENVKIEYNSVPDVQISAQSVSTCIVGQNLGKKRKVLFPNSAPQQYCTRFRQQASFGLRNRELLVSKPNKFDGDCQIRGVCFIIN